MEVARSSKLNPWAEPFVPGSWHRAAAPEVEDFSPEWWRLVATSPSFRDTWLRDYGDLDLLLDAAQDCADDVFFSPEMPPHHGGDQEMKERVTSIKSGGEVAPLGIEKWWRAHVAPPEVPRYAEKAPKRVVAGARPSRRPIQQPR